MSLSNLGGAYHRAGRHAEGLEVRRQALEIYRAALGEDAPMAIRQRVHVADSLRQLGDPALFAESEQRYRVSIAALESSLPDDHLFLGDAKAGLAQLLLETGRAEEAGAMARDALEHRLAYLAEDDPLVVEINELIAACATR
jgi:tetratricopeptide (TPR) repeat protein